MQSLILEPISLHSNQFSSLMTECQASLNAKFRYRKSAKVSFYIEIILLLKMNNCRIFFVVSQFK